jgi:O-antigen/teichoic acid export membrane protein
MSLRTQAVRNVSATWLGLAVNGLIGFLLSPFILHRLGDEAFSVWILVFALTGYFGLLDLGIRSSIVRYTARFIAADDKQQLSTYLSTSLAFYGVVALIVLFLTGIGYSQATSLLKIRGDMFQQARTLFLLSGVGIALTFPLSVFAGALEGLQRFAWLQLSQIGITLIRAGLIVVVMTNHGGLLAIGTIAVVMNLLGYVIFACLAIWALPVRLSVTAVEAPAFWSMAKYGLYAFAILAAEKLRLQSDAVVIGAFLSASAITMFSIGSRLVEYSSYAVRSMSQIVTPMSSQFHATGDLARLQRTFVAGNRACALVIFPLCVVLVVLGKPIIGAWVGARYLPGYSVLVLLIIPRTLYLAQSTSTKILLGMGRHRVLASVLLLEGAANLLLSLLLVRRFGILGVALGTAIPMLFTSVLFLPRHLCRVLEFPLGRFLSRAYALPLLLCAPLAGALWFIANQFPSSSSTGIILQVGAGGLIYCASLTFALLNRGEARPRSWQALVQLLEPK